MKKDIKIVIPCYDRFDLLRQTLQSLKDFNIIFDTCLFYDGIAPREVKEIAHEYKVDLKETGLIENLGADIMIYKSTMLFKDHVLVLDSDTKIVNDFTSFILDSIKPFENDNSIVGISISKTFKYLNKHKGIDVMPYNIGCGTIYDKKHLTEAYKIHVKQPHREIDSLSGKIARDNKLYFINSYKKFTQHLGDKTGFHSHLDIVHI